MSACYYFRKNVKKLSRMMETRKYNKGTDDIETTVDIDINVIDYLNFIPFLWIVLQQKGIPIGIEDDLQRWLIKQQIDGKKFESMKKKEFAKLLNQLNKDCIAAKLFNLINKEALNFAQSIEMGKTFNISQYETLTEHYQHVLNIHINRDKD